MVKILENREKSSYTINKAQDENTNLLDIENCGTIHKRGRKNHMAGSWNQDVMDVISAILTNRLDSVLVSAGSAAKNMLMNLKNAQELHHTMSEVSGDSRIEGLIRGLEGYQLEELCTGLEYLSSQQGKQKLRQQLQKVSVFGLKETIYNWAYDAVGSKRLQHSVKHEFADCYTEAYAGYLEAREPEIYRDYWAQEQIDRIMQQYGNIQAYLENVGSETVRMNQAIDELKTWLTERLGEPVQQSLSNMPHNLTTPPPMVDSACFLGREDAMEELRKKVLEEKQVAMISGLGGIGKTTMARQLYHEMQGSYPYAAWVVYRNNLKDSIQESFLLYDQGECADAEERFEKLWQFMTDHASELLLFIDNVNELTDDDREMQLLRSYPITRVITSRLEKMDGYVSFPVDFLSREVCVNIFYQHYRKDADRREQEIVEQIIDRVKCHTLSVELVARYAQEKVSYTSLRQLLAELEQKNFYYPEDIRVSTDHAGRSESIAAQLANLFDISEYREGMQRIAKAFSILPAEQIPKDIAKYIEAEEKDFAELVKLGLLKDELTGYSMQPVVQESIRHQERVTGADGKPKVVITVEDCQKLMDRFSDNDFLNGLSTVEAYRRASYIDAFRTRFTDQEDVEKRVVLWLYRAIGDLYQNIGECGKALLYFKEYMEIAEKQARYRQTPASKRELSYSYGRVGDAYRDLGAPKEALNYYEKALKLTEKLNEENPSASNRRYLSISYNRVGDAYTDLGVPKEALKYYEKDLKLTEELNAESPSASIRRELSISNNKMGDAYRNLGAPKEALNYYEKALKLTEELNEESPSASIRRDLSISYYNMGRCFAETEDFAQALKYLRLAEEGFHFVDSQVNSPASRRELELVRNAIQEVNECL